MSKEYKTHNDDSDIDDNDTSLMGYMDVSYDRLVELFGEPCDGDGYKTDAEWSIEFDDGTVATIYNWKNGPNYRGGYGDIKKIKEWNIGGKNHKAVDKIHKLMPEISMRYWEPQSGSRNISIRTVSALALLLICASMWSFAESTSAISVEEFNES